MPETLDGALDTRLPCLDDTTHPGLPRSLAPGGPSLPCCFRRLSDPLFLPHREDVGDLVHLEDLERDALLAEEAEAQPAEVHKLVQHPPEGPRPCEKDVKRKLEFGSTKGRSGSLPQVDELEKDGGPRAGRWRRGSTQLDRSLIDQENLNNNNSKRSCPDDFEVGWGPLWGAASLLGHLYPTCSPLCTVPTSAHRVHFRGWRTAIPACAACAWLVHTPRIGQTHGLQYPPYLRWGSPVMSLSQMTPLIRDVPDSSHRTLYSPCVSDGFETNPRGLISFLRGPPVTE